MGRVFLVSLLGCLLMAGVSSGCLLFATPHGSCASKSDCGEDFECVDGLCLESADPNVGRDAGQGRDAGPSIDVDAGPIAEPDAGPLFDAGPIGPLDAGPQEELSEDPPSGWYRFRPQAPNQSDCLSSGLLPTEGASLRACSIGADHLWRFDPLGGKRFRLKARLQGDRRCLDGQDLVNGAPVRLMPCQDAASQVWTLVRNAPGYLLKNNQSAPEATTCLTGSIDGIFVEPCDSALAQTWFLERISFGCSSPNDCASNVCDFVSGTCVSEPMEQSCLDADDDDDDGFVDCADRDCLRAPHCAERVITVPNASFEEHDNGALVAWTINDAPQTAGSSGVAANSFSRVQDGLRFMYQNLTGFAGPDVCSARTVAGGIGLTVPGRYTLTAAIGRRTNDATTDGSQKIELLAEETVIAETQIENPFAAYARDTWTDHQTNTVLPPGHPRVGEDLSIQLSTTIGTGIGNRKQGQFDDVRLTHMRFGAVEVKNPSFEHQAEDLEVQTWIADEGPETIQSREQNDTVFSSAARGARFQEILLGDALENTMETAPQSIGAAAAGTYVVTLAVGRDIGGNTVDDALILELLAGDEVIATTTVQNPQGSIVSDTWIDVTFSGTLGTAAPTVGEDLRLRMTARATVPFRSAFVDDVRVLFVLPPNSAP